MKKTHEEILKSLQETIEKAKKALAGIDRTANLPKYRTARKRLKRAQRSLMKWKKLSTRLEERKKGKEKAAPAEAPPS